MSVVEKTAEEIAAEYLAPKRQVGSVVQLKSGGFSMTVEEIGGGMATCVWIDKSGKFQRQCLSFDVLKKGTEGVDFVMIAPNLMPQIALSDDTNA